LTPPYFDPFLCPKNVIHYNNSISVLNVTYPVPNAQPNAGVWATLSIKPANAQLHIFDAAPDVTSRKLLASYPFEISEAVALHHWSKETP